MVKQYDVAIIGAGASGLMAAGVAVKRGKTVTVIEMGDRPARKVAVSGGGNCNITNTDANYTRYFGENPNFVRGALARFTPFDALEWARHHKIKLYEKTAGRYFCENGAGAVVGALTNDANGADFLWDTTVLDVAYNNDLFCIKTSKSDLYAKSVIVATGGTSFATLGVSDIGLKIAKKFGHKIVPIRPGLCGLVIKDAISDFSGISVKAQITIGKHKINDDLLFTHFGIGGPLAYRTSLYDLENGVTINIIPDINLYVVLKKAKQIDGRKKVLSVLSEYIPMRVAKYIAQDDSRNIADIKDSELQQIASSVQNIHISGDKIKRHGLSSAEVVCGGVSTAEISSKTMESKLCRGLFFAGEVLDVTGDLGGFNLQWAWSSGFVAGSNA
jgi:predicted Rossmann fold flavoprotein